MIMEEAEEANVWTVDRHDSYPTTDFVLEKIGLNDLSMNVLREYGFPVARFVWGMTGDSWDKNMTAENFLAKYTPSAQGHLDSHIDDRRLPDHRPHTNWQLFYALHYPHQDI